MAGDLIEMRLTGFDGVYEMLRSLPAEVVSKRGGVVKTALRKGARVFLLEEKKNLQAVTSSQTKNGVLESTGLLAKNLIITRGKPPTSGNGERYLVRVKRVAYDGKKLGKKEKKGKRVTTLKTAQLLEYGSGHQPAEPWIRPAFKAKAAEAIRVVEADTVRGIERAVKKLIRQGRR